MPDTKLSALPAIPLPLVTGDSFYVTRTGVSYAVDLSGMGSLNTTVGASGVRITNSGISKQIAVAFDSGQALRFGGLLLAQTGIAARQVMTYFESGAGQLIMGQALYSKQFTLITPSATNAQTVIGNSQSINGTLSTINNEAWSKATITSPAATDYSIAYISTAIETSIRGSQTGKNGFFFLSKFLLTGTNGINIYGAPSGSRIFVGLSQTSSIFNFNTGSSAVAACGLAYTWATGGAGIADVFDTNWKLFVGGGNGSTYTDSTMNFNTGVFQFAMYCPPFPNNNTMWWQLDDMLRGSGVGGIFQNSAIYPAGNTYMFPFVGLNTITGTKTIGNIATYVETIG